MLSLYKFLLMVLHLYYKASGVQRLTKSLPLCDSPDYVKDLGSHRLLGYRWSSNPEQAVFFRNFADFTRIFSDTNLTLGGVTRGFAGQAAYNSVQLLDRKRYFIWYLRGYFSARFSTLNRIPKNNRFFKLFYT